MYKVQKRFLACAGQAGASKLCSRSPGSTLMHSLDLLEVPSRVQCQPFIFCFADLLHEPRDSSQDDLPPEGKVV